MWYLDPTPATLLDQPDMECVKLILDILTLVVATCALGAACWAGYSAWGAYLKQGEELDLAKDQHRRFVKTLERADRANSPYFTAAHRVDSVGVHSFANDGHSDVVADFVLNSQHFSKHSLFTFADEDNPTVRVYLLIKNLRKNVKLVNISAFAAPDKNSERHTVEMFPTQPLQGYDEGCYYMLSYDLTEKMIKSAPSIFVTVVFETADGMVESHEYMTIAAHTLFSRLDPPGFNELVERKKNGPHL